MATTRHLLSSDSWTDLGATPCAVQATGSILLVVASGAPGDLNAPAVVLTNQVADIGVSSQNVYARSAGTPGTTAVVVR